MGAVATVRFGAATVQRATTAPCEHGQTGASDRERNLGEPALCEAGARLASGGGQSSPIRCSWAQRVTAP